MPWKQTDTMSERIKMLSDHLSGDYTATALARKYAVSRKSVYKWLGRYEAEGWGGLDDESRAPHRQASAIGAEVEAAILELKARCRIGERRSYGGSWSRELGGKCARPRARSAQCSNDTG